MLRIPVFQNLQWNSCKCLFLFCDATAVFCGALTEWCRRPLAMNGDSPALGIAAIKVPWDAFGNKEVLEKSKQMDSLENKVIRKSISLYLHNKLNKDCIFLKKPRSLFVSSPLCNYKYFLQCNFASVLQCAFLITVYIWSDTVVLICVTASTCDVCLLVCQVICAERRWAYGFKYLGLLYTTSRMLLMS